MLTQAPRGTKDILPRDIYLWHKVEDCAKKWCANFAYQEIRTPMFEHTELFLRGIGNATDVVDKEMYTFTDRGDRSITLRPENTASVVRTYLENKLFAEENVTKLFYIGSMFRYDRPQAGRYREFHQFGVEAIGEQSPLLDAEVIMLARSFLSDLGLKDLELRLNSVGCPRCRPLYRQKLQDFFRDKKDALCKTCQVRYEQNPLRILDCKSENCKLLSEGVPRLVDSLCDECKEHFSLVQEILEAMHIPFILDDRLVRGLDYYTKTAFEIKYLPLGAQSAVAGGGRYDGLIKEIGEKDIPAVGFAIGLERVILALTKQKVVAEKEHRSSIFIAHFGKNVDLYAFKLLMLLRGHGLSVEMDFGKRSLKAQLKEANKKARDVVLIIGDDEVEAGMVTIKDMVKGTQKKVQYEDVLSELIVEVEN